MTPIAFKVLIDGKVHDVKARENVKGLAGIWHNDKLYEPCPQSVRDALPAKWLAAYGRTNGKWWFPKNFVTYCATAKDATFPSLLECSLHLRYARTHKHLAHLRAIPYLVPQEEQ